MSRKQHPFGRCALRIALLASTAMLASACSMDWADNNLESRLDQQAMAGAIDPYELGKKQFAHGLYGMALKNFRVALVRKPNSIDHLNAVAATYDKLGRFDLSERYYARALAIDPQSGPTLNNVGYSFLMQNDYVSARYYLERAATMTVADARYNDIIGANLISLDTAEGRAVVRRQHHVPGQTADVAADTPSQLFKQIDAENSDGQMYTVAMNQDAARVDIAVPASEQIPRGESAGSRQVESVLVPAASPGPMVAAAPVVAVRAEPLPVPVDEPAVKTLGPPVEAIIEVSNGNGRRHMAARTRQFLKDQGIPVARITNARNFGFASSTVLYREGFAERAREICGLFPFPIEMKLVKEQRADVRLRFGRDALDFDSRRLATSTGV